MFPKRRTLMLSVVLLGLAVLCLISPHFLHLEAPGAGLLITAFGLFLVYGFQRRREQGLQEQMYVERYTDGDVGESASPTSHGSGYIGLDFTKSRPPERV